MSRASSMATDGRSAAPQRPIIVICPHFKPDTAPTGIVMTRIVDELVTLGHAVHVVTALPWYRRHAVEPEWIGSWVHVENTSWGSVTRAHPFPGDDKANLLRRAAGFLAFSMLAVIQGLRAGGWFRKADAVFAMSPPLTLGLTGWIVAKMRRAPLIFNIQDVFPDAAIDTGAISNPLVIGAARWLEQISYRAADAVTVLSDDLRDNVAAKMPAAQGECVHVIPNFVDTTAIVPTDRATNYRTELGLGSGPVVLYAGNVGFSQSLELVLTAASALPEVTFLINGDGAARSTLESKALGLKNVRFAGYIEVHRLSELLATGDIHLVPLKAGLGRVSVPSKTYSILAAARPVVAAIDKATAVPRILESASAGISIPPDDAEALIAALRLLLANPDRCAQMGASGRRWVETHASPAVVGLAYDKLLRQLRAP